MVMDPIIFATTEALVGMALTILLLGLLGAIFFAVGKIESWLGAAASRNAALSPPVDDAASREGTASGEGVSSIEEDLPFISAGVYLYLEGRIPRKLGSSLSVAEECRGEWKRSARLCAVGLR